MSEKEFVDIKTRCYNYSIQMIKFLDSVSVKNLFYSLINQLLRSTTSVGANLIEAKSAHSKKDFIKFYEIALKSANETKYWICLLRDGLELNRNKLNELLKEVDEISKIIATIIIKLKDSKASVVKETYTKYSSEDFDYYMVDLNKQYNKNS